MSSATTAQVLQKQQTKLPSSMRYERIQQILEKDPALGPLLSPKNQPIDSRFGEKMCYSKEVVAVTQAIHAEGKDAQKLGKNEVLRVAMVVMKNAPGNLELRAAISAPVAVAPPPPPASPVQTAPVAAPKRKGAAKPETAEETKAQAKPKPAAPVKPKAKAPEVASTVRPAKGSKATKNGKPEDEAEAEASTKSQVAAQAEAEMPESELPPERQPLRLPREFDSSKWPHYDVQNSVYCLLLSALNLSEHFEKYPGYDDRQKKLESLLKDYLVTCDQIKVGS